MSLTFCVLGIYLVGASSGRVVSIFWQWGWRSIVEIKTLYEIGIAICSIMRCRRCSMTWFCRRIILRCCSFHSIRILFFLLIIWQLLQMPFFQYLLITIRSNLLFQPSFIRLHIKINIKLSLQIFRYRMCRPSYPILIKILHKIKRRKLINKNNMFFHQTLISLRKFYWHLIRSKISIITKCKITILTSIKSL